METNVDEFVNETLEKTGLLLHVADLEDENRKLKNEMSELRVLARLDTVISLMEGTNARQHRELLEADQKYEDLQKQFKEIRWQLEVRSMKDLSPRA